MKIESITPIGSGKHIRLELSKSGFKIQALKFSCTAADFPYEKGDSVDLAVGIKRNEYMNRVSVSIIIKNLRPHGVNEDKLLRDMRVFERLMRSGDISAQDAASMLPDRELNAAVYRFIRSHGGWNHGIELLCTRIGEERYGAVYCSVEAMKELSLLESEGEKLILPSFSQKVSFDDAPVIKKLKSIAGGDLSGSNS